MPRQDIQSFVGEEFAVSGLVTKNGAGFPLGSVTNYNLLFTAKRKKSDPLTAAIVAKALIARANYATGDVTLIVGGPYTVKIDHDDTAGKITKTELLYYDIVLIEPDGTQTVVDYGTWKISPGAGS